MPSFNEAEVLRLADLGDARALRRFIFKRRDEINAVPAGTVPDEYLDMLEYALTAPSVRRMENSWFLLSDLTVEWPDLTIAQQDRVVEMLRRNYGTFADDMTHGEIVRILGQVCGDRRALGALGSHISHPDEMARRNIAGGLSYLVESARDVGLRQDAVQLLRTMAADRSPAVRRDVAGAFEWLEREGTI